MVETTWNACNLFDEVYRMTIVKLIKDTVNTVIEKTKCAELKFFQDITPGENRGVIETCAGVC